MLTSFLISVITCLSMSWLDIHALPNPFKSGKETINASAQDVAR